MIDRLTKKQKEMLPIYRDRYIKKGLSTKPFNKKYAQKIMNLFYGKILKRKPVEVVICDNPLQAFCMCFYYKIFKLRMINKKIKWNKVWNEVRNEVRNEVGNKVRNKVWNEVKNEVRNEVEDEVRNKVMDEVWDEVWNGVENEVRNEVGNEVENGVENEVWDEVWNEVRNKVENEVRNEVWNEVRNEVENEVRNKVWNEVRNEVKKIVKVYYYPYLYGSFDSSYISFYSYMRNVLNIKYKKDYLYKIYEKTINMNFIYCLKNICFVSQKPSKIQKNNSGQLHCEDGPALSYKGFDLWRLNGVRVPRWLVITPASELTGEVILKEKNVEIRREMLRKIGIERVIRDIGAGCIDNHNGYELYLVDIGNERKVYYLKMKNPSLENTYHFECVHPSCDTVQKALEWRNQTKEKPVVLT